MKEHAGTGLNVERTEEILAEKRGEHDAVTVSAEELARLTENSERWEWILEHWTGDLVTPEEKAVWRARKEELTERVDDARKVKP